MRRTPVGCAGAHRRDRGTPFDGRGREEGRRAAARFSTALDGLAPHQRRRVEERYESEYLALSRASWRSTAERAGRLREEYEERYRALRRRPLAGCLLGWCAALGCLGGLLPGRA